MSSSYEHSPAMILRAGLVLLGKGSLPTDQLVWPLYVGQMPDKPDEIAAIFDTTGKLDGRTHVDGVVHSHPGVMIRIRSNIYTNGYAKANQLRMALEQINHLVVPIESASYTILVVSGIGDTLSLGKSEEINKRDLFSINAQMAIDLN